MKEKDFFSQQAFGVEHALSMYAQDFVVLPAEFIYENEVRQRFKSVLDQCHIYIIGTLPTVEFLAASQDQTTLVTNHLVGGREHNLEWLLPEDVILKNDEGLWFLEDAQGNRGFPNDNAMHLKLNYELNLMNLKVLYVGQAYGEKGSRNALDRLLKHETLQKISLKEKLKDQCLQILTFSIVPNRMITFFNPHAKNIDDDEKRISDGLDKLFETNELERITLFEAALIKYFQPLYNREFKDSFPSTRLKVLQDCYDKDIASLVVEICADEIPFKMYSDTVAPSQYHVVRTELHDQEDRKIFFHIHNGD